jgi:cell fate regulator YaaT (PSP1 superfamily)
MTQQEYIVGYGLAGDFGRFRAGAPLELGRGDRVVVRSGRGLEVGEVLRPATPRHALFLPNTSVGELLRPAGAEDEAQAAAARERAARVLRRGGELAGALGLPLALLDAEVLLGGDRAVLHLVRWEQADVRELVSGLAREFDLHVELADLSAPADEPAGCGSCGDGGGCGSCGSGGGCGSCGTAAPEEVREHFAGLREKMEKRVPLL